MTQGRLFSAVVEPHYDRVEVVTLFAYTRKKSLFFAYTSYTKR